MPKRSFDAIEEDPLNQCPQMKIHIGPKEVMQIGVCGQQSLSAIHSKTLALLYAGSKQCFSGRVQELATSIISQTISHEPVTCQLQINANGGLVHQPQVANHAKLSAQTSSHCPSCNAPNCVMFERCAFCEYFNCSSCLNTCVSCGHDYCPKCSVTMYSPVEGRICLTCATEKPHH